MQTLFLKVPGPDGKKIEKPVKIVRAWVEAGGRALYLHAGGLYGSIVGAPVKSASELDQIPSAEARRQAQMWWEMSGKKLSEAYYAAEGARLAAAAAGGLPEVPGAAEQMDAVLYQRRPIKDRSKAAWSGALGWKAFFAQRPDWWGAASVIELGEWRYQRIEAEEGGNETGGGSSGAEANPPGAPDEAA